MKALLQRVTHAHVKVNEQIIGEIQTGILILVGIEKTDNEATVNRLVERVLGYRIFTDDQGKMNLNVQNIQGGLLWVPQFTLVADTKKGMRPSFSSAAAPTYSKTLFESIIQKTRQQYPHIATGQFGAHMQIELCNDGPVTFLLAVN
jgi:D-aminoacyl-tRNA deacylase